MKEKLHPIHIGILIYMTQTAVVILSLPRSLAEHFGTNGWVILIPVSLFVAFNIFVISIVYRMGKGRSVFAVLEQSIPKAVLFPLYLAVGFLWALIGSLVGKQYVLVFQMSSYQSAPPMVLKFVCDFLAWLLINKGIHNIAKASTIFFVMIFWMILLLFYHLSDFSFTRLTPFFFQGETDFWNGLWEVYSSFLGFELSLLLFPYVASKTNMFKAVYAGHFLTSFTYLIVSFVMFGFFSLGQLTSLVNPVIDLLALIQLPFVERIENLLFGFLLYTTLITSVMYFWAAQEAWARVFHCVKPAVLNAFLILSTGLSSLVPKTAEDVRSWLKIFVNIQIGVAIIFPVFLILLLTIQNQKKRVPKNA